MQDRDVCLFPGPQPDLASAQHMTFLPGRAPRDQPFYACGRLTGKPVPAEGWHRELRRCRCCSSRRGCQDGWAFPQLANPAGDGSVVCRRSGGWPDG
jgi:hypothetical protein